MKKLIYSICLLFMTGSVMGQAFPEGIPFQAQIFSSSGALLSNQTVGIRFNIHASSMGGTIVWQEDHTVILNDLSHFSVVVGAGTSTGNGTLSTFDLIEWGNDNYFLELLVDENNGGTYNSIMTQQMLAVPYAYHSKTSSQEYALSQLTDVDTTGIQVGDILKWNGTNWVPSQDNVNATADTVNYSFGTLNTIYADTAFYALNCLPQPWVDSVQWSNLSDTANFSILAGFASNATNSIYADTATVALVALGNWALNGNANTDPLNDFVGTTDSVDLVFRSFNTEQMRIKANGMIGIGTANPLADLHVENSNGVLFKGTYGSGTIPIEGGGARMMWYPGKAAFRAGEVTTNYWDDFNIGSYSIASGYNAKAAGDYSVAFGFSCESTAEGAISMGQGALSSGLYSFAVGHNPQATGDYSIAIGRGAIASNESAVAIGYHPEATAQYSYALGNYCSATQEGSFAMGYHARSYNFGSFIWADQSDNIGYVQTNADNQFMVRSSGGAIFYSSSDLSTGVTLPAGGGAWSTLSDRNKKENITALNPVDFLVLLDKVDVFKWNYIAQDASIEHIGPMAQDFFKAFGLGNDPTTINSGDFDGVNLLLLKALFVKVKELDHQKNEVEELQNELEELRQKRMELEERLTKLETLIASS